MKCFPAAVFVCSLFHIAVAQNCNPIEIGSINVSNQSIRDFQIVGDKVFLVTSRLPARLAIIDISNPQNITLDSLTNLSGANDAGIFAVDILVVDSVAYIGTDEAQTFGRILSYDVSNTFAPVAGGIEVLRGSQSPAVKDMESSNGILYVAAGSGGIQSFDISTPLSPVYLDDYINLNTPAFNAQAIDIVDGEAYLANSGNARGLTAIDISNPSNLNEISFASGLPIPSHRHSHLFKQYSIVAGPNFLYTYDVSSPSAIVAGDNSAVLPVNTNIKHIAFSGATAIMLNLAPSTAAHPELIFVDHIDPLNPVLLGAFDLFNPNQGGWTVEVQGNIFLTGGVAFYIYEAFGCFRCNDADLAMPFGILDGADVNAFNAAFVLMNQEADLAAPFGIFGLADVNAFVALFLAGCP